jgi:hypothetical protein
VARPRAWCDGEKEATRAHEAVGRTRVEIDETALGEGACRDNIVMWCCTQLSRSLGETRGCRRFVVWWSLRIIDFLGALIGWCGIACLGVATETISARQRNGNRKAIANTRNVRNRYNQNTVAMERKGRNC